jgi:hypothetical protein
MSQTESPTPSHSLRRSHRPRCVGLEQARGSSPPAAGTSPRTVGSRQPQPLAPRVRRATVEAQHRPRASLLHRGWSSSSRGVRTTECCAASLFRSLGAAPRRWAENERRWRGSKVISRVQDSLSSWSIPKGAQHHSIGQMPRARRSWSGRRFTSCGFRCHRESYWRWPAWQAAVKSAWPIRVVSR